MATQLLQSLPRFKQWESKLHVLQSIAHLTIAESQKGELELFLRDSVLDKNKFIRAWGYHGLAELARQHPEYQEETAKLFELALKDEAPSVKARLKKIIKSRV